LAQKKVNQFEFDLLAGYGHVGFYAHEKMIYH